MAQAAVMTEEQFLRALRCCNRNAHAQRNALALHLSYFCEIRPIPIAVSGAIAIADSGTSRSLIPEPSRSLIPE